MTARHWRAAAGAASAAWLQVIRVRALRDVWLTHAPPHPFAPAPLALNRSCCMTHKRATWRCGCGGTTATCSASPTSPAPTRPPPSSSPGAPTAQCGSGTASPVRCARVRMVRVVCLSVCLAQPAAATAAAAVRVLVAEARTLPTTLLWRRHARSCACAVGMPAPPYHSRCTPAAHLLAGPTGGGLACMCRQQLPGLPHRVPRGPQARSWRAWRRTTGPSTQWQPAPTGGWRHRPGRTARRVAGGCFIPVGGSPCPFLPFKSHEMHLGGKCVPRAAGGGGRGQKAPQLQLPLRLRHASACKRAFCARGVPHGCCRCKLHHGCRCGTGAARPGPASVGAAHPATPALRARVFRPLPPSQAHAQVCILDLSVTLTGGRGSGSGGDSGAGGGAVRSSLTHAASGATCCAFAPSGLHLASGGRDACVRVWHVPSGAQVRCACAQAQGGGGEPRRGGGACGSYRPRPCVRTYGRRAHKRGGRCATWWL